MNDLTGLIPLATGIVISPLPIVAIVAILLSRRGRANGLAFALTSLLVSFGFTLVAAVTTAGAGAGKSDGDDVIVLVITAVLSVGFLVLAWFSWRTRPRGDEEPKTPAWLAAVDTLSPLKAAGLGALMGVTNSKNIPLELKAGSLIGAHDLPIVGVVGLSALFAIAAMSGILLLTVVAAFGSARITSALQSLKATMIRHNAVIMTVLFAILAATEISHLVRMLLPH